jgi:hypothetical protein
MRFYRVRVVAIACWLVAGLGVIPCQAEPITAGGLTMVGSQGSIQLTSPSGFSLTAQVDVVGGFFAPWNLCLPCRPGGLLEPDANWVGNDLRALTVNGEPVPLDRVGEVRFEGNGIVPLLIASALTELVQTNVVLSGFIGPVGQRTFLTGTGVAFITLGRIPDTDLWTYRSAEYRLDAAGTDPVPEPATLIFVGTGIAGLWFRRKSRVRQP